MSDGNIQAATVRKGPGHSVYKLIDDGSFDAFNEHLVHQAASMQEAIEYCKQHGGHHTAPSGLLGVLVKDKNNFPRFRID